MIDEDVCVGGSSKWFGVTCSNTNVVVQLKLSANNLVGSLPSEIGLLSDISQGFDVSLNSLVGTLPVEIGALTGLTTKFFLYVNGFTGPLPASLGQMSVLASGFNVNNNGTISCLKWSAL
jgi:hypothetical protein